MFFSETRCMFRGPIADKAPKYRIWAKYANERLSYWQFNTFYRPVCRGKPVRQRFSEVS